VAPLLAAEVLGSLKCDCAEQLALALETIYKNEYGIVIYLQQEGRGIGLANKIAAYSLQVCWMWMGFGADLAMALLDQLKLQPQCLLAHILKLAEVLCACTGTRA
jgi:hypothetical protein